MSILLPLAEVVQLRSIKKIAVILMLLLRLDGQPVTARDVAETLEMDYETTRKHLYGIAALGLVVETRQGWIVTHNARQLSTGFPQKPVESAEIPRCAVFLSSSSTAYTDIPLLEEEEEEEKRQKERGKTALSLEQRIEAIYNDPDEAATRVWNAMQSAEEQGLHLDSKLIDLIEANLYITDEYVKHHADRLKREKRFSNGLLIKVLQDGDPVSAYGNRYLGRRRT